MAQFSAFEPMTFVTILLLTFGVFLVVTGVFTAYFGSGKSRKIGAGLLVGGLVIGFLWVWLVGINNPGVHVLEVVIQAIGVILAAAIGAGLAIGLFLLAIMKS